MAQKKNFTGKIIWTGYNISNKDFSLGLKVGIEFLQSSPDNPKENYKAPKNP